ncbi:MAG: M48 family metalloprotease [Nitrospirota bacterium]|nr:M48 family metalloprotease [Nitrospirota bacterium]
MKRGIVLLLALAFLSSCATVDMGEIREHMGMITATAGAARKAMRPISDEEEYYVGRAVAARILSSYPLSTDQRLAAYINMVGQTVSLHSEKPCTYGGYHFALLESAEMNAFACPGGIVFITRGMLNAVNTEDELAAVLAHEIAHVNKRDGISAIKQSRWTEAVAIIGSTAAREYGSTEFSQLVDIFEGSVDDVVKTIIENGYGKSQEYSADKTALVYLSKSAYDPSALKNFLERTVEGGNASGGGLFKTHPATADRLENIKDDLPAEGADILMAQKRAGRFISEIR